MANEELKEFIYHKNGWIDKAPKDVVKKASRNKNINGEKIMRLFLDGKCIYRGPVQFCQKKKKIIVCAMVFQTKSLSRSVLR